jgi:uncharacterized protein
MKTFEEFRQVLSLQKQSLCEIYQITEIGIFGSYRFTAFATDIV